MRFSHLNSPACLLIICSFISQAQGQSNTTDRASDIKARSESSHTLAEAVQSISDSPLPVPPNKNLTYEVDGDKYDLLFDMSRLHRKNYYKTVNLLVLSKPADGNREKDNFQSDVTLGLNNPYYNLKNEIHVIGNFDLRFDNIIWGFPNTATITLGYDLKKPLPKGASRINVKIDYMAFSIGIPFHLK